MMVRHGRWLAWAETSVGATELTVLRAHAHWGSEPFEYFVAAPSRAEAVELLRAFGFHGFRFRADQNDGVPEADVAICAATPNVVLRRHFYCPPGSRLEAVDAPAGGR
jgi:hypothetical protein